MFWTALRPLLSDDTEALTQLDQINEGFTKAMEEELEKMWARKLGLHALDTTLMLDLLRLMVRTRVDYTMFFRALSHIPEDVSALKRSFYQPTSEELDERWQEWLSRWRTAVTRSGDIGQISDAMKRVNPAITWREWLVAPAYKQAEDGHHELVHELQAVLSHPYDEVPPEFAAKYDRLKPRAFFNAGGVSHYSCSS